MLEIENWSKDRVHAVMQELLYSFNYMWFLMEQWVQKNCPEKIETAEFHNLMETFGSYEAKRLEKTVDPEVRGVERLAAFLKHSHWCAFEDIEAAKLSERQLRMRTRNCTAQQAAKKWGMTHYECGAQGLRLRKGFFAQIHPGADVERIFTPPEEKPAQIPAEISCEWLITVP